MIISINKKYFYLLFINICLIMLSTYSNATNDKPSPAPIDTKNTINYNFNGKNFAKKLPDSIINYYKKDPMTFYIPSNELFSEPLQLLVLQDLLKSFIEVLNKFNIDNWVTENTLYELLRFNSFSPWADEATIAIDYNKFKDNFKSIKQALKKMGIEFDPFNRITRLQHIPYLRFTKQKFYKVIRKHEPTFSSHDITAKYNQLKYQNIQINIYPFAIDHSLGAYNLLEYLHDNFTSLGGSKNGYDIQDVYPLQKVQLNNIVVNTIHNPSAILIIKQYLDNIYSMNVGNTICINSTPIHINDIRKHPDFLTMMNAYLNFTFKDSFSCMSKDYLDILATAP